jgi:hypothetical protein
MLKPEYFYMFLHAILHGLFLFTFVKKRHAFSRNITPSQILFSFISQPSMQKALTCSLIPLLVYTLLLEYMHFPGIQPLLKYYLFCFSLLCKKRKSMICCGEERIPKSKNVLSHHHRRSSSMSVSMSNNRKSRSSNNSPYDRVDANGSR